MARRVQVIVGGDVQGVGFRWYCREEAFAQGVRGFVRNLPDGRVEAVFEGDPDGVGAMIDWCRRGPSSARVLAVEVEEQDPLGDDRFVIAR
jgi:acylphosphatase